MATNSKEPLAKIKVGEKRMMQNGLYAEVLGKLKNHGLWIKWEDGLKDAVSALFYSRGEILHPEINARPKGHYGTFINLKKYCSYPDKVYYQCECKYCKRDHYDTNNHSGPHIDALTPQEMMEHSKKHKQES